jgi:malate dehydrogenase
VSHALIDGKPARQVVNDEAWIRSSFIPQVQQRGAAIIKARGASSAASAANAAIDHIRDWVLGTNQWVSMAVASKGLYGVDKHVYFSYPCTTKDGKYTVVKDLKMDAFAQEKFELTKKELYEERDMVASMLK